MLQKSKNTGPRFGFHVSPVLIGIVTIVTIVTIFVIVTIFAIVSLVTIFAAAG